MTAALRIRLSVLIWGIRCWAIRLLAGDDSVIINCRLVNGVLHLRPKALAVGNTFELRDEVPRNG